MKKILLLLPALVWLAPAGTIQPRSMEARDYHRHYDRGVQSEGRGHNGPILSTLDATAQISSVVLIGASSEATTYGGALQHHAQAVNFIEENRIEITQDMAQAKGEHLSTLLAMLELKNNSANLLKIQSEFDTLSKLSSTELLAQLKAMQS